MKRTLRLRIRNSLLKFMGHVMKKESLEYLMLTADTEGQWKTVSNLPTEIV